MIRPFPRWKYTLLSVIIALSAIYAIPNWYGDQPAVQVLSKNKKPLDEQQLEDMKGWLADASISDIDIERTGADALLIKVPNDITQLKVSDLLKSNLQSEATVAMNLVPATPHWMSAIGANPLKLGLDLRGGVHFLIEVDVESAILNRLEGLQSDVRSHLRSEKIRYRSVGMRDQEHMVIRLEAAEQRDKAMTNLRRAFDEVQWARSDNSERELVGAFSPQAYQDFQNYTIEQTISTLRNRVNELGVAEAMVQRQGAHRVVVELPGIQDTARAKEILGKTATLEFRIVDTEHDYRPSPHSRPPAGSEVFDARSGEPVLLKKRVILTGDSIVGATTSTDSRDGRPVVSVRIAGSGVNLFKRMTRENVGKPMATLYIETETAYSVDDDDTPVKVQHTIKEVISVATIQSALGSSFQISGFSRAEAADLALLLRAGALPASISIVEEKTIGPTLGQENIQMGILSIQVGLGMVVIFMMLYYSWFGMIANITLVMNLVMLLALLSMLGATLTLPGIAGIVLTLGMAVDANVLIFERIREEIRNGQSPLACIQSGFDRAMATIVDSNLTTLIVGLILFSVGTGPVKGFAVTLCLGIITSLITAVTGTKALVHLFFGRTKRSLPIGI